MIPTTTYQSDILLAYFLTYSDILNPAFYVAYICKGVQSVFWHSIWHSSGVLSGTSADILSAKNLIFYLTSAEILSGIYSDILETFFLILSGILSGTSSDILSHILSGIHSCIPSGIPSDALQLKCL